MPRPGNMLYLVSYDLPSTRQGDRRRSRLARYLEGIGLRVQWSVFELDIDPRQLDKVCAEIEQRIDEKEDSVRIYTICGTCAGRQLRLGKHAPVERQAVLMW